MIALWAPGARAAEAKCVNPNDLDSGAKSLRASLNYTDAAPEPAKSCSACAFFTSASAGCGGCSILSGPVDGKGRCDSWSPKSQ